MSSESIARVLLSLGMGFVFLYFGIEKFLHPLLWIDWLPAWMDSFASLDKNQWLKIIGAMEIAIGLGILAPFDSVKKWAALLATLHLGAILTQTGLNDIAVRDIGLLFMATALFFLI